MASRTIRSFGRVTSTSKRSVNTGAARRTGAAHLTSTRTGVYARGGQPLPGGSHGSHGSGGGGTPFHAPHTHTHSTEGPTVRFAVSSLTRSIDTLEWRARAPAND